MQSMPVYNLTKLMDETRRIASEYRASTGSTLPVSSELAKFDAIHLLGLRASDGTERAVDAWMPTPNGELKVQVKARVLFRDDKSGYRVGQLNMDADWDVLLLVLMNEKYETTAIHRVDRTRLLNEMKNNKSSGKNSRGALSVKKFIAIAQLCWPTGNE